MNYIFKAMEATFVGQDGSMGLVSGQKYKIHIYNTGLYVIVDWGHGICPYASIASLSQNWK